MTARDIMKQFHEKIYMWFSGCIYMEREREVFIKFFYEVNEIIMDTYQFEGGKYIKLVP